MSHIPKYLKIKMQFEEVVIKRAIPNYENYSICVRVKEGICLIENTKKEKWVKPHSTTELYQISDKYGKRKWLSQVEIATLTFTMDELDEQIKMYNEHQIKKMFYDMKYRLYLGDLHVHTPEGLKIIHNMEELENFSRGYKYETACKYDFNAIF